MSPRRLIQRDWHRQFWNRPVRLWPFAVVIVAMLVGFGLGFNRLQDTSHQASAANKAVIQEIANRQYDACVSFNASLDAQRAEIEAAFAPGATTRTQAPPDPALKDPEVVAYIQRLLDSLSVNSNASNRDRVLGVIPANATCQRVARS